MKVDAKPWLKYYGPDFTEVEIPEDSLYGALARRAAMNPELDALEFMGTRIRFSKLIHLVDQAASALQKNGIGKGDCVTLALPNIPNAMILFYALNKIGARVAMVHPLSPPVDLAYYLTKTESRWAVTVDLFVPKFMEILSQTQAERLLVAGIGDYLPAVKAVAYKLRSRVKLPSDERLMGWKEFMATGKQTLPFAPEEERNCHEGSVILFSGGTTDQPKGILLSDYSFNALAAGIQVTASFQPGDSVMAILPIFHGFGLGLCVHLAMVCGGMSILIPKFSPQIYISALIKYQPQFIAGVPTLFEALLRNSDFAKVRFEKLKGAFSGGDTLSYEMKQKFDTALRAQGSKVDLLEGYGTTECVTGCVLTPPAHYRKDSIGVPLPNMETCIVREDTTELLPYGKEGEICIAGPQLMLGYLDDCEATAKTLRVHPDGKLWLHTGDQGFMDEDGYLYFRSRIKRIFKVSGVNVYPPQVESILESHPKVSRACVVGLPDDYQGMHVKAFVVLRDKGAGGDELAEELRSYCAEKLIKWSIPRVIEFRADLPTTLVGKVAYATLEKAAIS